MTETRIMSPEDASEWRDNFKPGSIYDDVAHTAAVLGERVAAAVARPDRGSLDAGSCQIVRPETWNW